MQEVDLNGFFGVAVYWFVGIGILITSYNFWKQKKKLIANGIETEGVIFDMAVRHQAYGGTQHPVVRFLTKEDVWITETYDIGESFSAFERGQRVNVIYNPENPKDFILKADQKINIKLIALLAAALAIVSLIVGAIKLIQLL